MPAVGRRLTMFSFFRLACGNDAPTVTILPLCANKTEAHRVTFRQPKGELEERVEFGDDDAPREMEALLANDFVADQIP